MQNQVSITWPQYLRQQALIYRHKEKVWHLTYFPKHLLEVLVYFTIRFPDFISRDNFISYCWPNPDEEPDNPDKTIEYYLDELRRRGVKFEVFQRGRQGLVKIQGWRFEPVKPLAIITQKPIKCQAINSFGIYPSEAARYKNRGLQCNIRATSQVEGKWLCQRHQRYLKEHGQLKTVDKVTPMPYKAVRRTKYGN